MSPDETFPEPIRLLDNYERCLCWRLELWFPSSEWALQREGVVFRASHDGLTARLIFHPPLCRWQLESDGLTASGNFDRISKRLRQLFSFGK